MSSRIHLTDEVKTINVSVATVAGTTTVTSSVVDMTGYDACRFLCGTGDATSGTVLTLTAKSNSINATTGSPTTEASSTVTSASATDCDEKILIVDVIKPTHQYVFATLARATQNCVMNYIICELYRSKALPVTADATVVASTKALLGGTV